MLIDSHCHLPENLDEAIKIVEAAKAEEVVKFVNIGTSLKSSAAAIAIAEKIPEVYATVGIYPHEERDLTISQMKSHLEKLLSTSKKIVGIGECGIDITDWQNSRPLGKQIEVFEMQVVLAIEHDLPLIIHDRNGDEIVLQTLLKHKNPKLRGIAHCFASYWEIAQRFMDNNFDISFSGLVTYPSRKELLETVINVPNEKFVVETDSPYLPPQGHRGEKNEPKYVKIVAQKVAEVRQQSFEEISTNSYSNTCKIFALT